MPRAPIRRHTFDMSDDRFELTEIEAQAAIVVRTTTTPLR
jgi:hypothetical protein